MSVATFSKTGLKATTPAKLDKTIFGLEVSNHQLLKEDYLAHLAAGRVSNAKTKRRGEVRGGGRKPWRQKGTGRARAGSRRSPLWRGGGITFGPTGEQNFGRRMTTSSKRQALRQALSLAASSNKLIIIEDFASDKTSAAAKLLTKVGATGKVLLVSSSTSTPPAVKNLPGVEVTSADNLVALEILNAGKIVLTKAALEQLTKRLGVK